MGAVRRVVAVLLATARVATRRLQVTVSVCADPDVDPCGRNCECAYATYGRFVRDPPVGRPVGEALPRSATTDTGFTVVGPDKFRRQILGRTQHGVARPRNISGDPVQR